MIITRISRVAIAAALLCLFATGCRYTAAPSDLLMKPALSPDKETLMEVVNHSLPQYGKLTLPLREDKQGAVRQVDLNGDGVQEAIVSYYNEYSSPELMVLRFVSGAWKPWVFIQQAMARQIDWMQLGDFNQDGQVELAIGWIGAYESPNQVDYYSFQTKPERNEYGKLALQPIRSLPYVYAEMGDINGDGQIELAVIAADGMIQDIETPRYRLALYDWKDGELHQMQELELYSDVDGYDRMLIGRISPRHHGIVVEASLGAHSMYTAMYAWDNGKLRLVYPVSNSTNEEQDTQISITPVKNEDVNGDGIIELMKPREAPGYADLSYAETIFINDWVQWDGKGGFNAVKEEYSNYAHRLSFTIPAKWSGHYTLRAPSEEENEDGYGIVTVEYWNEETSLKTELATMYGVPQQVWEQVEAKWKEQGRSVHVMKTGGGLVYTMSFVQQPPAALSSADKEAFESMLLEKDQLDRLFYLIQD